MALKNNFTTQTIHLASLGKCMLLGAGIAFILISIFLLGARESNPAWHKLWMVKPLLVVPFSGAIGGASFYLIHHLFYRGIWRKLLAAVLSLVIYLVGLWLGTVLGLNGTYWN